MTEIHYTIPEAATATGLSVSRIRGMVERKEIRSITLYREVRNRKLIPESEIVRLQNERAQS